MSDDQERLARMRGVAERYPREFHDYAFLLRMMDERVTELFNANNNLVSERRVAQGRADHFESAVDFLLSHNGMAQLRRLEAENRELTEQRDQARHEMRMAQAQAEIRADANDKVTPDGPLAALARVWGRSILTLRAAMKPNEQGKKGNVLEANRAYTEAHLVLLAMVRSEHTTKE